MLLALLFLLPVTGSAKALPPSFEKIAQGTYMPGASALHGDTLVWASPVLEGPDAGRVDLKQVQAGGRPQTLTSIVGPAGGVTVTTLAFDGRWVAWIDDRFGNAEVFVLDVPTGALRRLTSTPAAEEGIVAAEGRAAWTRGGTLLLADLATGKAEDITPEGSQDAEPCLTDAMLVWSRGRGDGTSSLEALRLGTNATSQVMLQESFGQRHPRCTQGLQVAWETLQYYDPSTGAVSWIRQVRWAELGGEARDLRMLDRDRGLLLGAAGTWIVWRDHGADVQLHDAAANATYGLGDVAVAGVSAEALVVARPTAGGEWSFHLQRWDEVGKGDARGAPGLPLAALAFALLVAFARRRA